MDARTEDRIERTAAGTEQTRVSPGFWDRLGERFTLTPLNRRRWQNFKANRRGYWSLIIFLAIFVLSLFAEVIANDRPLVVRYKGEWLFPVAVDYPESKFGGFLATTNYEEPVIADEIRANGWMIWPPIRYSYSTVSIDHPRRVNAEGRCLGFPHPPFWTTDAKLCPDTPEAARAKFESIASAHWLGVDANGRDVVARVLYGFRTSVLFGLILTAIASMIGITAGAVQGYFGGSTDLTLQRVVEIWSSVPSLFVLMVLSRVLTPGFWTLLLILLLFHWITLVGVVRAEFLRARNFEYIRAARALGLSDWTIMFKHMLPNAMVATLTFLPFKLSGAIAALTALDFLGLGLPPGSASLGELLLQAKNNLTEPHLGIVAFLAIATLLSLLIFIGEGLRDALDPRKTFR
jgi:microcin C transport system permease protein